MNVRPETIKFLEENIGFNITDSSLSNVFMDEFKGKGNKSKNNKWDYSKLKSFCTAKETIKMKR